MNPVDDFVDDFCFDFAIDLKYGKIAENGERESLILHGTKSLFNLLVYFPEYKMEDNRVLELINRKLHGNDILLSYTKKSKHSEFEVVLIQEIPLQFY